MSIAINILEDIDVSDKNISNVILSIFNNYKCINLISHETNISKFKVQQILELLDKRNLVLVRNDIDSNNMIKKEYKLQDNLSFIDNGKFTKAFEMTKYFTDAIKELLNNLYLDNFGTAHNVIIKCDKDTINKFYEEYNKLLDKFESMEAPNSEDSYAFVSAIGRFKKI